METMSSAAAHATRVGFRASSPLPRSPRTTPARAACTAWPGPRTRATPTARTTAMRATRVPRAPRVSVKREGGDEI